MERARFLQTSSQCTHSLTEFIILLDKDVSRKRMGLSQHVLTLIEKNGASFGQRGQRGDSSEMEEQCRQRCKYSHFCAKNNV